MTKVLGQSGKITITGQGVELTFQVDSIAEVDQNGTEVGKAGAQKHALNTLATQQFTFSAVNNVSYFQGLKVINVNLTATLSGVNAKLDIMLYLFLEDGNVNFGTETFKVFNGSLKFNIQVLLRKHFVINICFIFSLLLVQFWPLSLSRNAPLSQREGPGTIVWACSR